MVKLVNVYPNMPITSVNPPIRSRIKAVTFTVEDIRKCLIANAYVEEILNGGKTIQLTFDNYNKDNEVVKDVKEVKPVKTEAPKVEPKKVEIPKVEPKTVEIPVVKEEKVEEPVEEVKEEEKVEEPVEEVKEPKVEAPKATPIKPQATPINNNNRNNNKKK